MNASDEEIALSRPMRRAWLSENERSVVYRRGQVVVRECGPWASTVHSLLRHLEDVGFAGAPRVVGSGFDPDGRETLSYIEGEFTEPGPWSLEGAADVGRLLRDLHEATASFRIPPNAIWSPWYGRALGGPTRVISHCDVAQREGLPPLEDRAHQLRAMVDAYGLSTEQRSRFVDMIIEFVVHDTAFQADEAGVTPDTTDPEALWGLAWRARAAAWIFRHRRTLQDALL